MTMSNAVQVVYLTHECQESWDWDDYLEWLMETIETRYKSFERTDGWEGREGHIILKNGLAKVMVCEYCGLVSVNLVPDTADEDHEGMADNWCRIVADGFAELFPNRLKCIGRASNGEAFYERVSK